MRATAGCWLPDIMRVCFSSSMDLELKGIQQLCSLLLLLGPDALAPDVENEVVVVVKTVGRDRLDRLKDEGHGEHVVQLLPLLGNIHSIQRKLTYLHA